MKSFDGAGWSYAAWLTPQGRMITDMAVVEVGDEAWLDVPAPLARSLAEKLDLDDLRRGREDRRRLGSVRQHRGRWTRGVADHRLCPDDRLASLDRGGTASSATDRIPSSIVTIANGTGWVRPVHSSTTRAAGLEESLAHGGAVPLDDASAETLRIEAAVPRFLVDMTEETIPLEANLDHAISHTKGCYVGQEIIVRIRDLAKGRVARRLVGLLPEGDAVPVAGATVVGRRKVRRARHERDVVAGARAAHRDGDRPSRLHGAGQCGRHRWHHGRRGGPALRTGVGRSCPS